MANVILTPQLLTKMTMVNLGNYLNVASRMNTDFAREFGNKSAKIGETFNVRKPQIFGTTSGLAYQPQAIENISTPVTVNEVKGVHFDMDDMEKTLSIDYIQEKYAQPAAIALASDINRIAAQFAAQNTPFSVGTPGTTPSTRLTYLQARSILIKLGLPENTPINCVINSTMNDAFVDGQATLFNPTALVGGQYRDGMVAGSALGLRWAMDETLYVHTVGTYSGSPVVNGAQVGTGGNNATMTLNTNGWGSGVSGLNKGDRFTIGSGATRVDAVNPQTKQSKGIAQQFVVVNTITDTAGAMALEIFPAITPTGPYQNVTQGAANGATINVIGTAGAVSLQGLAFARDAFGFCPVPLENPEPGTGAVGDTISDPDTGIKVSYVRAFDATQRRRIFRMDCLFGFARLYAAEMSCAIYSGL